MCHGIYFLPNMGIQLQLGLNLEYISTVSKQTRCISPLITTDEAGFRGK